MKESLKILDDGTELRMDIEIPDNARGKTPMCIILHGFTGNRSERHLLALSEMMNEIGMATLRVDLYGHGESGGDFKNHTLYKWLTNALTVIDFAAELPYVSDLYLCGHSQGGLTAVMAGSMKQTVIKGLIPLSPAIMIPEEARNGNILGTEAGPDHLTGELTSEDGWTINANYANVARTLYPEESMKNYKRPVLIVQGEDDKTVPIDRVREMSANYEDCEFVSVPGETHCYDYHLDQVVDIVKDFIIRKGWNV